MKALIRLPDPGDAPGFRDGVRELAGFRLEEIEPGWGSVTPSEGAGAVATYFTAYRLCDANTVLTDTTWEPIRKHPGHEKDDVTPRTQPGGDPDPGWRRKLIEHAGKLDERNVLEADLAAVGARIGALPEKDLPPYLERLLPALFDAFPQGSLWLIAIDPLLYRRFALMRCQLALETTADVLSLGEGGFPGVRALSEHSITDGIRFSDLIDPLLITFSPGSLGVSFDRMPHALVFLFGIPVSLIREHPRSLTSLYEPHLQSPHGLQWMDAEFFEGLRPADAETLLQWWMTRLNVVYSHICDPTRFVDSFQRHQPLKQTAWFLTFERMLADALLILAGFQGPALARQQAAFDLLDKVESLMGFGSSETSRGFELLLRRRSMLDRLDEVWEHLPVQLRPRFRRRARKLYDGIYADVREHALQHRLTSAGVKVGSGDGELTSWSMERYVPAVVRAVRNSAHGLFEQLAGRDRYLLATHDGQLPPQLGSLGAMIAFGLVAEPETLCTGTWLPTFQPPQESLDPAVTEAPRSPEGPG
jgi:hypothetical protein